jgi:hypothetical protein
VNGRDVRKVPLVEPRAIHRHCGTIAWNFAPQSSSSCFVLSMKPSGPTHLRPTHLHHF